MKKFVAYCRTSTENQKEERTIELQVEALTRHAEQHDVEIIQWFKDDGVSGGLEHRPQLIELMKSLELNNDVQGVLIYKLDRLARDLYIQEGLIREFNKLKKDVVSTLEPDLASNDPFRKAFRQILGVFAEFEKAMITLRMKGGRDSAVAKGRWHGGLIYGYESSDGSLVINKSEAEIIKKIYYLKRYQKQSPWQIAKYLNENKVPTKRKDTIWHPSTISKILNNKIYKGIIIYKGNIFVGTHKGIL